MLDFLQDNWIAILLVALYVVERAPEVSKAWKRRSRVMVEAIERYSRIVDKDSPAGEAISTLKHMIEDATPPKDRAPIADLIADAGDDKHERSGIRKVTDGVVRLLPLLSRFIWKGRS